MEVVIDERPQPTRIIETGFGFWASQILLSAVSLDLFTQLGDNQLTADRLGEAVGIAERGRRDFFDALVALGFLDRDGNGDGARYRNTRETAAFLDKNKPDYIGGILEMAHDRLYRFWADLEEGLRSGRPQNEIKHSGKPMFEELYADPARLESFINAMTGISRGNFEAFVEKFDFGPYASMCDVGGASGLLAGLVAKRYEHMACTTFDLPPVAALASQSLERQGLADRVRVVAGDFFRDPLPQADVITMGMILHDWNLDGKMHLIRRAYDALPPGGVLVAIENLIDDERRTNAFGLMMSLNMLIEFGDAFDFSGAEFHKWCTAAGFRSVEILHLNGPCSAAVAYK